MQNGYLKKRDVPIKCVGVGDTVGKKRTVSGMIDVS
jgi:hypothetical protein